MGEYGNGPTGKQLEEEGGEARLRLRTETRGGLREV